MRVGKGLTKPNRPHFQPKGIITMPHDIQVWFQIASICAMGAFGLYLSLPVVDVVRNVLKSMVK